ncbi:chemotaxis protein CheW [Halolactibacillus miurensis]|uniref:Chemotaxis protein CheW n=1 Tax=Halolactibacillus miurensis TaxID=306541 RepID=A0A1I6QF56_9BACI|nr:MULTISPECIES: chemotaxis protein CheW [Halolactibacillus]GEM03413.1 chemotaxis protein CheW [Halolactibacillus miurensis]SFS50975.1 purine-binding chemotaxis protein CheW [Halolactibacillus miurensis]
MALEFLKSIVFELNDEEYALPVDLVGAIERVMPITRIPGVPPFVKGVLNLRGVVTPVIDLRERFNFEAQKETEATRVIIIQHDEKDVGLIVDACYDVIDIPNESIEPAPETIGTVKIDYINGVAKYDERLLILLNIDEILSTDVLKEFYEEK